MDKAKATSDILFDTETAQYALGRWMHVFLNKDEEQIFVDIDILKSFNLSKATYCGKGPNDPVLIYEEDVLSGMVMPVKVSEKKEERE